MKVFEPEFIYCVQTILTALLVWVLYLSIKDEEN